MDLELEECQERLVLEVKLRDSRNKVLEENLSTPNLRGYMELLVEAWLTLLC
jgi:hypothetical protein